MPDDFDPRRAVYTPSQVATYGLRAAHETSEAAQSSLGISIPIYELSSYVPPVLPGQIMAIIAQTSNYKSGFMHFLEDANAQRLTEAGLKDHIIISVSVEESIEEQSYLSLSTKSGISVDDIAQGNVQDWSRLEEASHVVGSIPIYRIGESLARADDMPNLYISNMIRAIDHIVNGDLLSWRPKVAGIFFDYLQAFPLDPEYRTADAGSRRRLQVRSDIYRLRQCAAKYQCPVIVAVQAKQHLEGAKPPIMLPGQYDGEESSAIGQRADRILTLWMPKQTHAVGETIIYGGGNSLAVLENTLWIRVAKQRGRLPAGKVFKCSIDFGSNLVDLEIIPKAARQDVWIPEN
jgi:hypothetical protein